MKILVVHNHYRQRGGEDSVFETERDMLRAAGHEVLTYERDNGFDERRGRLALAAKAVWNWTTYREIRELLRRERPDAVHCHNVFPVVSPSVYWAAAAEGVPVVQTLHNFRLCCLNGYFFRDGAVCRRCLGRPPLAGVAKRCYRGSLAASAVAAFSLLVHRALGTYRRKVSRYVALTEFAREQFAAAGLPPGKIAVKPNAVAPAAVAGPAAGAAETGGAPVSFLYLGRISEEKGPAALVEAWRLLCGRQDSPVPGKARLVMAGDGPLREELQRKASGLPGVTFLGLVPRGEVPSVIEAASALVMPSLWFEQFAISPIEAMQRGKPVIVSRTAVHSTLVEDGVTGAVFDERDPGALADVLQSFAENPAKLAELGARAKESLRASEVEPGRNLGKLLEIYRGLA